MAVGYHHFRVHPYITTTWGPGFLWVVHPQNPTLFHQPSQLHPCQETGRLGDLDCLIKNKMVITYSHNGRITHQKWSKNGNFDHENHDLRIFLKCWLVGGQCCYYSRHIPKFFNPFHTEVSRIAINIFTTKGPLVNRRLSMILPLGSKMISHWSAEKIQGLGPSIKICIGVH